MHQHIQIAGTGTTVGRTTRVEITVLQQPCQQLAVVGVPLNMARLHHVLRSLLAGIECLGARKQEILAGKIDVDTQKEVCTGFAGYLAAVLQRHKRIVGTRQNDLDARLVLAYESRYAVGELQCQVLLQHLVQAGTLVFAAMSGIEHPHQRAQLPGCACQRQEQRYEDDKTFHTAKLLKIRSPSGIGNRFLGETKAASGQIRSLVVSPTYISGEKRGLLCPQKRTAVRWLTQHAAMRDAAHCDEGCSALRFSTKNNGQTKARDYSGQNIRPGRREQSAVGIFPKGSERWEIQRKIMPEHSLHFLLCQ